MQYTVQRFEDELRLEVTREAPALPPDYGSTLSPAAAVAGKSNTQSGDATGPAVPLPVFAKACTVRTVFKGGAPASQKAAKPAAQAKSATTAAAVAAKAVDPAAELTAERKALLPAEWRRPNLVFWNGTTFDEQMVHAISKYSTAKEQSWSRSQVSQSSFNQTYLCPNDHWIIFTE
jgi:hypothetical protein